MANDETLAALEMGAFLAEAQANRYRWDGDTVSADRLDADAALIRALIERERNGGERAQIVAWLRQPEQEGYSCVCQPTFADAIASGAHLAGPRVLSVNVVQWEGE